MPDVQDRVKKRYNKAEDEVGDIGQRLQHQVNELIDRLTGVRKIRRQYLSMGLSAGVLVGVIVGIAIGIAMSDEDKGKPHTERTAVS